MLETGAGFGRPSHGSDDKKRQDRRIGLKLDRAITHWISAFSILLALGACAVAGAWGLGRTVSDRFLWTQYLAWIPTVIALPVTFVILVLSSAVALAEEGAERLTPYARDRRKRRRRVAMGLRALCWLGVVWMGWTLISTDLNLGASRKATAGPVGRLPSVTMVYWNLANWPSERTVDLVRVHKPDIAIIANAGHDLDPEALRSRIDEGADLLEAGPITIVSRDRLVAWGITSLGFKGKKFQSEGAPAALRIDPGRAMWIAIDVGPGPGRQDARPFVAWIIDLPSDPTLSRHAMALDTSRQLAAWKGTIFRRGPDGPPQHEGGPPRTEWLPDTSLRTTGFPKPDVMIGDFNIPRGSRSLDLLTRGEGWTMENAFDQAGIGYVATWPIEFPLWHIDQTFIADGLRATSYKAVNPRAGLHWIQVVTLGTDEPNR